MAQGIKKICRFLQGLTISSGVLFCFMLGFVCFKNLAWIIKVGISSLSIRMQILDIKSKLRKVSPANHRSLI